MLWIGNGRSKKNFRKFFNKQNSSLLTDVIAVAMDMHASCKALEEGYMPQAKIVYDRYHSQLVKKLLASRGDCREGLAEVVFFDPKLYKSTARGRKND